MTASTRRRLMLSISVVVILIAPWAVTPWPQAVAQVDTTTTTEPTTTTTAPPTTTTQPTTTTTRPRTTTTRRPATTTTTTTTTLPPTTTTIATTTTTTLVPQQESTTTVAPTTTTFAPRDPSGGFVPPEDNDDEDTDEGGGLPGWSLPFLGAGAMLAAIVVATGLVRFFTAGIPAIGRGLGTVAYRISNGWAVARDGNRAPSSFGVPKPTLGARIGGFFLALTSPFRRRDDAAAAQRLRDQKPGPSLWDRVVLRLRMVRARFTRTRSTVEGQRRYWWLRFRRFIPWLR